MGRKCIGEKPLTDTEKKRRYRAKLRLRRWGIHDQFKAIVATPWETLGQAPRLGMWETIWEGDYDQYLSRSWDAKLIWQGDDQYASRCWNFCYWPAPGHERPKRWLGRDDDYQPAIDEEDPPTFDATKIGHGIKLVPKQKNELLGDDESRPSERDEEILREIDARVVAAQYGKDRKWPPWKIRWRNRWVNLDDYYSFKRWGPPPRCMLNVPMAERRPLGQSVELVPVEVIDAPARSAEMDGRYTKSKIGTNAGRL